MNNIKKSLFLLPLVSAFFFFTSCGALNKPVKPKSVEVDFSKERAVRCVYNGHITSFNICEKNGGFSLLVTDREPSVLSGTEILFLNDNCTVTSQALSFSRAISEYSDSFLPKILYIFIKETDFSQTAPKYDKKSGDFTYSAVAAGKFVQLVIEKNAADGEEYLYTFKVV